MLNNNNNSRSQGQVLPSWVRSPVERPIISTILVENDLLGRLYVAGPVKTNQISFYANLKYCHLVAIVYTVFLLLGTNVSFLGLGLWFCFSSRPMEEDIRPVSQLMMSVKNNTQVIMLSCDYIVLFHFCALCSLIVETTKCFSVEHYNVVLENVLKTRKGKKKAQPVNKDRFISKIFLHGDSVIIVLRNPK
ncbi:hypothetical protein G4B88_020383 [Cannabis sativa]|uniref:Small nuclear ribonucleoprotein Sm D2 n=1 Tax=Cannabis sativa TaxID=3483 RepID=A0A7J6DMN1_CANSA|nr:hypothetical protein G4B88_020383 [Cannabis sativa]